jgi:hypothetical protein
VTGEILGASRGAGMPGAASGLSLLARAALFVELERLTFFATSSDEASLLGRSCVARIRHQSCTGPGAGPAEGEDPGASSPPMGFRGA